MVFKGHLLRFHLILIFITLTISCSNTSETDDNITTDEDNTPPSLIVSGLTTGQTLSEITPLGIELKDNLDENILLEVFLDNEEIYKSNTNYTFEINPDLYSPGEKTLRFRATDSSQNSVTVEINLIFKRILIKIKIEENYFRPPIAESYAFISAKNGEMLDSLVVKEGENLNLLAPFSFNSNEDFILTLITKSTDGSFNLESIPNLNRELVKEFTLTNQGFFDFETLEINYGDTGFTQLQGLGYGYVVFAPDIETRRLDLLNRLNPPEHIFILTTDFDNGSHYFAKIKRDTISNPLLLNSNSFTSDNISLGTFPYTPNSNINVSGFENLDDFQNNRAHSATFGTTQVVSTNSASFPFIDNFPFYRHSFSDLYGPNLNSYNYLGEGLPLESYDYIDIDFSSSLVDGRLVINHNAIENYNTGKIHIKSKNQNSDWVLDFDAVNNKELILPKLPKLSGIEELDKLEYEIKSTRISHYSDINSYPEYVSKVRNNNLKYYNHSSFVEHITIWTSLNNRESIVGSTY